MHVNLCSHVGKLSLKKTDKKYFSESFRELRFQDKQLPQNLAFQVGSIQRDTAKIQLPGEKAAEYSSQRNM